MWGRFFSWLGVALLDLIEWLGSTVIGLLWWAVRSLAEAAVYVAEEIWRLAYWLLFSTWRRSLATLVALSLVAAHFWPQQVWPTLEPALTLVVLVVGLVLAKRIAWPKKKKKKK